MQKEPKGAELLATLINLLAEQEGVKITYEIQERPENGTTYHNQGKEEAQWATT